MHKQISAGGCRNRKGKQKAFQSKDLFIPWRPLRPSVQNGGEIHRRSQRKAKSFSSNTSLSFGCLCILLFKKVYKFP
jgi:hypothetical protein